MRPPRTESVNIPNRDGGRLFVIHISHRDEDLTRVVGPFGSARAAEDELTYSKGDVWKRDSRPEFGGVWHHRDDWPRTAVIVPLEGEL